MPPPARSAASQDATTHDEGGTSYLRFAAMIATSVLVMFGLTYANTYALAHVEFSETRVFMALLMGGAMPS